MVKSFDAHENFIDMYIVVMGFSALEI